MDNSKESTNSRDSRDSNESNKSLPENPDGLRRFIVIAKNAPKKGIHKEIHTNTSFDKLIEDIHTLHEEIEAVTKTGNKIMVDCSNCFSCLRGNQLKTGDIKATAI
jgi:hypothetical protein